MPTLATVKSQPCSDVARTADPNAVARHVLIAGAIASPVCTTAPRNSVFDASRGGRRRGYDGASRRVRVVQSRLPHDCTGNPLEDQRVSRNDIARPHAVDVARDDSFRLDLMKGSITPDLSVECPRRRITVGTKITVCGGPDVSNSAQSLGWHGLRFVDAGRRHCLFQG